jgi:hypothetical protein
MSKVKTEEQETQLQQDSTTEATIIQTVIEKLGTPPNFSHVNAVNVFNNRWRVNVYDKQPGFIEKRTIVASFYCIVNKKGEIKSPEIKKQF